MVPSIAAVALMADAGPALRRPAGGIPPVMPVYGVSVDAQGVTVSLQPAGCAGAKSDFTVAIAKSSERPVVLIARRSRADALAPCKGQPRMVAITWTYDDLGLKAGEPFSLANPLVASPGS